MRSTMNRRLTRLERNLEIERSAMFKNRSAAAEAILKAMRRLDADYKPMVYPPDWFVGYRGDAELINRAYEFLRQQPSDDAKERILSQPGSRIASD